MTRTSRLEVLIDTRSAEQKTRDMEFRLTAMQRAGDKAVAALKAIGADSAVNLQKVAMATGAIPMGANPAEQALRKMARQVGEAGKESKATRESLQAMALSMSSLSDGLAKTNGHVRSLVREIGELARGNESVSRSAGGASKAIKDEIDAFSRLAGKIDPVGRKLDELDRQQKDLDQYRKSGTIEPETHSDLSRRIETERERLTARRTAMDGASMSERQMADEHERQMRALRTLQSQYDPVTAKVRALDAAQQDANRHRFTGNLSDAEFKRITAGINEQREALSRYSEAQRGAAMSAGQLRNAQRMLPAQFTDIVVSLQGGQRPLTVLLQQGGQLKDMFGGVGQAARAMGGYVAGLVNPYTIAAAAIATTGYVAYRAANQFNEMNKALILAGRGSVQELEGMRVAAYNLSRQMSGSSMSAAASAIAEVGANGKIAYSDIEKVARISLELNESTGKSIQQTASEYAELGTGGVSALVSINDKYNFLSLSQYEHIKALYETGHATDAATEAQKLYAENAEKAAKAAAENLSPVEKIWREIKKQADEASNSMAAALGFGNRLQQAHAETWFQEHRKYLGFMAGPIPGAINYLTTGSNQDRVEKSRSREENETLFQNAMHSDLYGMKSVSDVNDPRKAISNRETVGKILDSETQKQKKTMMNLSEIPTFSKKMALPRLK